MLLCFLLLPSLKFSKCWHYYCVPRDAHRCHKHSNTVTIGPYSVSQVTAHLFLIKPYAISMAYELCYHDCFHLEKYKIHVSRSEFMCYLIFFTFHLTAAF